MKKSMLAVALTLLFVGAAYAVDWSTVTGNYEVQSGVSEVVTDADLPYVNALTRLTVNGSVRFDTTTPPTMPLYGSGTCSKTNDSDWTMSVAWPNWTGTWTFEGGMINYAVAQALGSNGADAEGNPLSEAQFLDGATLNLSVRPTGSSGWIYKQRIRISGTGKNNKGAIYASGIVSQVPSKQIGNIVLDDDATIVAKYFIFLTDGTLDLNGHKLSFLAEETTSSARSFTCGEHQKIAGSGEIELAAGIPFKVNGTDDFQFLDATPRTKLTLLGDNDIEFARGEYASCNYPDQYVDIVVHGETDFWHTHAKDAGRPTADIDDCGIVFHGDISLPAATDILRISSWLTSPATILPKCPLAFDGDILGLGKVHVPNKGAAAVASSLYAFLGTNSTCSGENYFKLSNGGTVKLAHPKSVGDISTIDVTGGQIAPFVGGDDTWTTNDLSRLLSQATFQGTYPILALDASAAPDGTNAVNAAFWNDNAPSGLFLGSFAGEVSLYGPLSEKGRLIAAGGTLRLTGDEPISIVSGGAKTVNMAKNPGTLLINQASSVTIPANGSISLPLAAEAETGSETLGQGGRMVISNATLAIETPTVGKDVWSAQADRVITVGATRGSASSYGILEIGAGADVTGKITLGWGAKDVGAVFQTGGTVRNLGQYMNGSRQSGPVMANAGRGYIEVDGGTWEQHGRSEFAYSQGSAFLLNLKSGSFSAVKHMLDPVETEKGWGGTLYSHGGYAHFYVAGGTLSTWGTQFQDGALDDTVVITLDGERANFVAKEIVFYNVDDNATGDFIVNLNDGVWRHERDSTTIQPYKVSTGQVRVFINFNGGTFQTQVLTSGNRQFFSFNETRDNMRLTVFSGGATFDILDACEAHVNRPLHAPKGKGVSAIPLPIGLADEVFVCPPAVRIAETGENGEGAGATAVAVWNRATGKVTGFRVTGAGDGYTEATATISYGADKSWTQVCTLADNAQTGGVVKTGTGTLNLHVTGSDYKGPTEVRDGTVLCQADYSLPSNGVLRMTGGTVNLVNYKADFASVGGTGGTLSSKSSRAMSFESPLAGTTTGFAFSNITPTFNGNWSLAASDILAGTATEYNADVTFGPEATLTIENFAALETDAGREGSPYVLFKVADGKTMTGVPTWTNPPENNSWKVTRVGNSVVLAYRRGMMMIMR